MYSNYSLSPSHFLIMRGREERPETITCTCTCVCVLCLFLCSVCLLSFVSFISVAVIYLYMYMYMYVSFVPNTITQYELPCELALPVL